MKLIAKLKEKSKIKVIVAALQEMRNVSIEEIDHDLMRTANRICQQIPAVDSYNFEDSFSNEDVEGTMTTYLGSATKTLEMVSDVNSLYTRVFVDKYAPEIR